MAATSYSTLPSSTYVGLGSQGDSYHSTNHGTYDLGIGSLASHPYQYQTNSYAANLTDSHQQSIGSNDYHQSSNSNVGYPTQQQQEPQDVPTNKYVQQSTNHREQQQQQQQQPQDVPTNRYAQQQQPQTGPKNKYAQQPQTGLTNKHAQQPQTGPTNKHPQQPQTGPTNKHPQQSQTGPTNKYAQQATNNQQQQLNGYSNSRKSKNNDRSQATNDNNTGSYATKKTKQPPHKKNMDNQHVESKNNHQNSYAETTQHRQPAPVDNEHQQSQSNLIRSEHQISNRPLKQQQKIHHKSQPPPQSKLNQSDHEISKARASPPPPPVHRRSSTISLNNNLSEPVAKSRHPSVELKPTKSSIMRAAAIKKKEETLDKKRKDRFFPGGQTKATPPKLKSQQGSPQTDAEQSEIEKTKPNKKQSHSSSKTQKTSHSDGEQIDERKKNHDKQQSHSQPKQRKSRRDNYETENNHSSDDDDNTKHRRSKSQKRATFSDSHLDKHPQLPPIHRHRMPPYYDPFIDYPLPPGHPLKGRFPYHDDYPPYGPYPNRNAHRHLYEDADDIPPYLAPYHDPYDPFFDYQKRKAKKPKPKQNKNKTDPHTDHEDNNGATTGYETEHDDGKKSQLSRKSKHKHVNNDNAGRKSRHNYEENIRSHWPPGYYPPNYYAGDNMLEIWRQERNDYLKKKFKPTIHDVLYSQQWMKSDSYLENQRRRALRDTQGYYFPYKKYTLKDYKDMQKLNNQNPFADINEITIDRKERARKRQEYGSLVERQMTDNPGTRHIPVREMPPRKPWHLSSGETHDPNAASKRERALEYAKVQVKYRPVDSIKNHSYGSDPSEQDINNHFPGMNDDGDESNNE